MPAAWQLHDGLAWKEKLYVAFHPSHLEHLRRCSESLACCNWCAAGARAELLERWFCHGITWWLQEKTSQRKLTRKGKDIMSILALTYGRSVWRANKLFGTVAWFLSIKRPCGICTAYWSLTPSLLIATAVKEINTRCSLVFRPDLRGALIWLLTFASVELSEQRSLQAGRLTALLCFGGFEKQKKLLWLLWNGVVFPASARQLISFPLNSYFRLNPSLLIPRRVYLGERKKPRSKPCTCRAAWTDRLWACCASHHDTVSSTKMS